MVLRSTLIGCLLSASLAMPVLAQDEPEFRLDIGTIAPEFSPWAEHLASLEERIERESDGRINVRVFLGSREGELSLARQCQDGEYQAVGVSVGAIAELVPQMGVVELPYLFSSLEEADRIIDTVLYEPLTAIMREAGFQFYLFSENGFRNFATRGVVVDEPGALASLQMRSQESWIHEETYRALGGNPVRIPVGEVDTALRTGTVDGFDNTPVFAFSSSWHLEIDTWTVSNHIYQPAGIVYNADWFDTLPSDLQEILLANIPGEQAAGRALIRAMTPALLANLERAGVSVHYLSDEQTAVFREATRPVHDMFRERVDGGSELLDLIENAR